eukprot:6481591-Amphidinium_carterae.1
MFGTNVLLPTLLITPQDRYVGPGLVEPPFVAVLSHTPRSTPPSPQDNKMIMWNGKLRVYSIA